MGGREMGGWADEGFVLTGGRWHRRHQVRWERRAEGQMGLKKRGEGSRLARRCLRTASRALYQTCHSQPPMPVRTHAHAHARTNVTQTEKLLLYGGAIHEAGEVKARKWVTAGVGSSGRGRQAR